MEWRAGSPASGGRPVETSRAACPACGDGELLRLLLRDGDGATRPASYCGGLYDRVRRRYVLPSCGYADHRPAEGPGAGVEPAVPALSAPL